MPIHPDKDDVVIRPKDSSRSSVFVLGTPSAPNQVIVRTRDEAVSKAVACARYQRVRAWFATDEDNFVLLGTFREQQEVLSESRAIKSVRSF